MLYTLIVAGAIAGLVSLILAAEACAHRFAERRWKSMIAQFVGAFFRPDPSKFTALLD